MRYALVFLLVLGPASQAFAVPRNYCARWPGQDFCREIAANAEAIANNAQAIAELSDTVRELKDRVTALETTPVRAPTLVLVDREGEVVGYPARVLVPGPIYFMHAWFRLENGLFQVFQVYLADDRIRDEQPLGQRAGWEVFFAQPNCLGAPIHFRLLRGDPTRDADFGLPLTGSADSWGMSQKVLI